MSEFDLKSFPALVAPIILSAMEVMDDDLLDAVCRLLPSSITVRSIARSHSCGLTSVVHSFCRCESMQKFFNKIAVATFDAAHPKQQSPHFSAPPQIVIDIVLKCAVQQMCAVREDSRWRAKDASMMQWKKVASTTISKKWSEKRCSSKRCSKKRSADTQQPAATRAPKKVAVAVEPTV